MTSLASSSERVLIFAPFGRDASLALGVLEKAGGEGQICCSGADLCQRLAEGAGAIVLAEEAITPETLSALAAALEHQEPWSDLPVIVLVAKGGAFERQRALEMLRPLGNVSLLERPVGIRTFQSTVQAAIRSRRRQYAARRVLEERKALLEEQTTILHLNEMFVGILSHDLRNPLSAILTAAQMLLYREENSKIHKPLTRILNSGERMTRMIEQLLDFTRARIGGGLELVRTRVSLDALCREVVEELELAHPERPIHVETRADLTGYWDADRVSQVFSNLLGNAVRYGTSEVPVRVELDGSDPAAVVLRISNGGAVPAAMLPAMFDAFRSQRGAEGTRGLGLGLYITQQIVVAHRGTIDITSTQDEGTSLIVRLPRGEAPDQDAARGA